MTFFATLLAKITGEAIKTGGEIAKTATEIPKNIVETKKASLEVSKLEYELSQREKIIVPATFDDVKEYDPNYRKLRDVVIEQNVQSPSKKGFYGYVALGVVIVGLGLGLVFQTMSVRSSHGSKPGSGVLFAPPIWSLLVPLLIWASVLFMIVYMAVRLIRHVLKKRRKLS